MKYQPNAILTTSSSIIPFNTSTGKALFQNISIDKTGMYLLSVNVSASDNSFDYTAKSNIIRVSDSLITTNEPVKNFIARFDGDYDELSKTGEVDNYKAMIYNYLNGQSVEIVGSINAFKGSLGLATQLVHSIESEKALLTLLNSTNQEILPGLNLLTLSVDDNTLFARNSVENATTLSTSTMTTISHASSSDSVSNNNSKAYLFILFLSLIFLKFI